MVWEASSEHPTSPPSRRILCQPLIVLRVTCSCWLMLNYYRSPLLLSSVQLAGHPRAESILDVPSDLWQLGQYPALCGDL